MRKLVLVLLVALFGAAGSAFATTVEATLGELGIVHSNSFELLSFTVSYDADEEPAQIFFHFEASWEMPSLQPDAHIISTRRRMVDGGTIAVDTSVLLSMMGTATWTESSGVQRKAAITSLLMSILAPAYGITIP